ncbi:MAG: hypothetical protein H6745_20655 [Deltaproteobacteria bacterium]|nr:hypothetical protein [Deltaproteobacteria bacterium]
MTPRAWTCALGAAASLAALTGCLGDASEDSIACRADDDCGACGRCDNGTCVVDEASEARPFCVDETEDPCNGVDDDGNGVVDDPESCWAPVWAWEGSSGARCFSSSPLEPPAGCAKYRLASETPAFTLAARYVRGSLDLHECTLGSDHVLVPARPLFGPTTAIDPLTEVDAWEALGYDCAVVLGRALPARPDYGGASTPYGRACALSRFVRGPVAAPVHDTWVGGGSGPEDAVCDPLSVVWGVGRDRACGDAPPEGCGARCAPAVEEAPGEEGAAEDEPEPRYSLHLVSVSPSGAEPVTVSAPVTYGVTLENTGLYHLPGGPLATFLVREAAAGLVALSTDLPSLDPGETWTVELADRAPAVSDGYRLAWGVEIAGVRVPVDGAATFTSELRVVDPQLHGVVVGAVPALGTAVAPGAEVIVAFGLRNAGALPWSPEHFAFRRVSGDLSAADERPVARWTAPNHVGLFAYALRVPAARPGRALSERWNLDADDGRRVAFEIARPGGGTDYGSVDGAFLGVELVVGDTCGDAP